MREASLGGFDVITLRLSQSSQCWVNGANRQSLNGYEAALLHAVYTKVIFQKWYTHTATKLALRADGIFLPTSQLNAGKPTAAA